jgi:hypothetical protein
MIWLRKYACQSYVAWVSQKCTGMYYKVVSHSVTIFGPVSTNYHNMKCKLKCASFFLFLFLLILKREAAGEKWVGEGAFLCLPSFFALAALDLTWTACETICLLTYLYLCKVLYHIKFQGLLTTTDTFN